MPFRDWTSDSLRRAIDAAGVALWAWDIEGDEFQMDAAGFAMWGIPQVNTVKFEDLSARIHPADRDRVRAAFTATRGVEGSYEIDFRIMIGDDIRWISARGLGNDAQMHEGLMYGIFLDVTGRKQAEEGHELLAGEMSHRVKNLLAIAAGLTQIASRSSKSAAEMAKDLTNRLTSLGRAHDLVRPLPGHQGTAALLGDLLSILLSPYEDMGAFSGRIRVAVPRMGVGERAATSLALVVHELATNSVKYGALSSDEGTLDVSGSLDKDDIKIVWMERGGPNVDGPADANGYGSGIVKRSVAQLYGTIDYAWEAEGLIATLTMKVAKLAN